MCYVTLQTTRNFIVSYQLLGLVCKERFHLFHIKFYGMIYLFLHFAFEFVCAVKYLPKKVTKKKQNLAGHVGGLPV